MVRCKFRCTEITERVSQVWSRDEAGKDINRQVVLQEARFSAVTGGDSPENKAFFAATPNGTLSIGTYGLPGFEAGKHYFVDLTEAE